MTTRLNAAIALLLLAAMPAFAGEHEHNRDDQSHRGWLNHISPMETPKLYDPDRRIDRERTVTENPDGSFTTRDGWGRALETVKPSEPDAFGTQRLERR